MNIRRQLLAVLVALPWILGQSAGRREESSEAEKLRVDPSVFLDGKPFPEMGETETRFAEPRRIFYASADAKTEGDGSAGRPWKELAPALCRLGPGDRLVLLPGNYAGSVEIGKACRPGRSDAPIQVFGEEAFFHAAENSWAITVSRPFWHFFHMQMVLDRPGAKGFAVRGSEAHDILFDRGHIYEGSGIAVLVGAGSARVKITNSHIHQTGGIRIEAGSRDIELHGNKVHHNLDASLRIVPGSGDKAVENLSVAKNKFHNDKGPALDLSNCRGARIAGNKIYNYRPGEASRGEAMRLGRGASDVIIEGNYFAEATVGVRADGVSEALLLRNYFENFLSEESVAIEIAAGRNIRVWNNTIAHYAVGIRLSAVSPAVTEVRVANNLILDASAFSIHLPGSEAAAYFDHNAFGRQEGKPRARVGEKVFDLEGQEASAAIPNSRAATNVRLAERDLAKVTGLSVRDAGKAFDGLTFSGAAPDIGVAEK